MRIKGLVVCKWFIYQKILQHVSMGQTRWNSRCIGERERETKTRKKKNAAVVLVRLFTGK